MDILKVLNQPGWDYRLTHEGVSIKAPTKKDASSFARIYADALTETAAKFKGSVRVGWHKCSQPLEFHGWMMSGTPSLNHFLQEGFLAMTMTTPELYIGETKVYTRNFLQVLLELRERKDENAGIVRLRDNQQLILTAGSAVAMGLEDATPLTRLKREDYWNLEDLAEFNREWRQQLREDGSNSFEFTYRTLDNPLDKNGGWKRQTSRYNLFVDGSELYHRGSVVDVVVLQS